MTRDRLLMEYDTKWPQYGFKKHKGYPTKAHVMAIYEHGPCPIHRMTFAPLKTMYPRDEGAAADKKGKSKDKGQTKAKKKKALSGGERKRKRRKR